MKHIREIYTYLVPNTKVVITHHHNPDADATGSTLALFHYLSKKGLECTVVSPNTMPDFLMWMPGAFDIKIYDEQKAEVEKIVEEASILFCLDFNHTSRVKTFTNTIENFKGIKVLIDHHLQPALESFQYGISDSNKSSTCEMVYDFIIANNDAQLLDVTIAKCIYAGTMTDTGSFRFSCTTASTHKMVAALIDIGLQPTFIHNQIFDTYHENRLRFMGYVLSNNMKVMHQQHVAYMALSKNELQKYYVESGDTEGIVNYPLSIKDVIFSTFMSQKEDEIRISFRSKGSFDVNVFSKKYFGGGGHANAAGARSLLSLEETIEKFKKAIIENQEQLETCYNELQELY